MNAIPAFQLPDMPWMPAALAAAICLLALLAYLLRWRTYALPARLLSRKAAPGNPACKQAVSVIVTARNQARELETSLPQILSQKGIAFEVIVVDDASTDDTEEVIKRFASGHRNLYRTFVPSSMRYIDRQKLAVTLGIRAARHEWVVLTGADCIPASDLWLASMAKHFDDDHDFVLGYANYADDGSCAARRAIYERLKYALRCFSAANKGKAIGGDGSNLGIRKAHFMARKGFSQSLPLTCGEDSLLVDSLASRGRTAIETRPEATVLQQLPPHPPRRTPRPCRDLAPRRMEGPSLPPERRSRFVLLPRAAARIAGLFGPPDCRNRPVGNLSAAVAPMGRARRSRHRLQPRLALPVPPPHDQDDGRTRLRAMAAILRLPATVQELLPESPNPQSPSRFPSQMKQPPSPSAAGARNAPRHKRHEQAAQRRDQAGCRRDFPTHDEPKGKNGVFFCS